MAHSLGVRVELEQLVRALSHLTLRVEHEAATEDVDFIVEGACSVALTAKHGLRASVGDSLPYHGTSVDFGGDDLFAGVKVQASNHVHGIANGR